MSKQLTIRADGSPSMGTGHVMRMIALGQAWQTLGGDVRFVGQAEPLTQRLKDEGFQNITINTAHPDPADAQTLLTHTDYRDWIAIDGYHFDTKYQQAIHNAGRRTLVVDDLFDRSRYIADILLNQNPDGPDYPYSSESTLLLGSRYALLRKEFLAQGATVRPVPQVAQSILVTLGGADPDNVTGKVLDAIRSIALPDQRVTVVAGAANQHLKDLKARIGSLNCDCQLLTNATDMPSLMAGADLAISAGGTTCWELCYLGVPFLAIRIADNQQGVIRELSRHKAARCLDSAVPMGDIAEAMKQLVHDQETRQEMRAAGTRLVDGRGARRVAQAMFNADIRLRPVREEDCDLLLEWRNAPEIRANSFSTELIPMQAHYAWLTNKLHDADSLFYLAEDENEPVGQIRFDRTDSSAVVSVSVAPTHASRGIGTTITRLGCAAMAAQWPETPALALIKTGNSTSSAMFAKAGFIEQETPENTLRFVWTGNGHDA